MFYNNPGGMAPKTGWQPRGFLAGSMVADQEADYRNMLHLSQIAQTQDAMRKQAEMQTYQQEAPVRAAKRGLDLATYGAQTPIQGDLAGAKQAEAKATMITAPSNAQAQVFKNTQHKQTVARELMGNYLAAAMNRFGNDPAQLMMAWRDQIVPQLEQQIGEPLPPEMKTMDISRLAVLNEALTRDAPTRRAALLQAQRDAEHYRRAQLEASSRENVARTKGDQTTSAEVRNQMFRDTIEARTRILRKQNPNMSEAEARDQATFEVYNNPTTAAMSRGTEARTTETHERDQARLQLEKQLARPAPTKPEERRVGELYRNDRGQFARWTNKGWEPVQ
jgi:hypothetical protein